jgi:chemotaxis protein methyltransferase CheR
VSAELERLREVVRQRVGISMPAGRLAGLAGAMPDGAAAVAALLDPGTGGHSVVDALVSGMNVGETYFFRDAEQMAVLERDILPGLIARRRAQRRLRVWSAGCSTGEEPYTLAIMLARLLPDLTRWDVTVLGTDLNGESLRRARRGVYRPWSLRGLRPAALVPYVVPDGDDFAVSERIRRMVTFERLNLAADRYPAQLDLVLCRNVLLYFDTASGRGVVARLRDALRPGGWLLLSPVEAGLVGPGLDGPALEPSALHPAVFRHPDHDPAPRTLPLLDLSFDDSPLRPSRVDDPPPPRETAEDAAAVCERAEAIWRGGDHAGALAMLADATGRYPLAADLHFLHGLVLVDGRRPSDAIAAFRRCTYAEPAFVLAHLGLAGALGRVGQRRQALASVDTADRLLADLDAGAAVPHGGGLRPAEVHELIAAHRQVLGDG